MDEKTTPTGQQTSIERKADVKFFDPSRWAQVEDLSSSGSVIQTQMLAEMIEKKIKDNLGVEFKVGIWDETDLARKIQDGWEVVTPEHWAEFEEWNKVTAARHGLQLVDGGLLMPNHGWICILPKDLAFRLWMSRQKRIQAGLTATLGSALDAADPEAKAEGKIKVTFSRAGQKDSEVAKMMTEQPEPTE